MLDFKSQICSIEAIATGVEHMLPLLMRGLHCGKRARSKEDGQKSNGGTSRV